jgi:transcriptional regulator with PAS, ATPase and Fis domain
VAAAYRLAESAVALRVPILIQGETGVGKEWLARHLHRCSGRAGAFVAVNCAALPPELFEAELFGYVGGAFTGARREGHAGLIASADGGTLMLDEIGELPLAMQAALLRFLDEPEVRPVGGVRSRRVDVLLLAATHADLEADAAHGRFRPDLMFRLDTVRVWLPPLRSRADFAALATQVLASIDAAASLEPTALAALAAHAWPGNFRELRSVLTRACLAAHAERPEGEGAGIGVIRLRHVQAAFAGPGGLADTPAVGAGAGRGSVSLLRRGADEAVRREFERAGGSISETARRLGISRTTVYRHLGRRPLR